MRFVNPENQALDEVGGNAHTDTDPPLSGISMRSDSNQIDSTAGNRC